MARIRKLGELDFFQQIEHEEPEIDDVTGEIVEPGEWVFICHLLLDNPIRIEQQVVDNYNRCTSNFLKKIGEEFDFQDMWYSEIEIWRGGLIHEPGWDVDSIVLKRFLPPNIVRAFQHQGVYKSICLGLYSDLRRPEGEHLCDLKITIKLNQMVENTDRFLQAFARKLNKWLVSARKSAV